MEQNQKNPLIEPENYWEGYQKSVDNLKNNPELLEFDKLCYELFENQEAGRKFMEHVTKRYLFAPAGTPGSSTFPQECMWGEGLRYFILLLRNSVLSHKQRIQAGNN